MSVRVVKVITASVYGPDGNEVMAPGDQVPYGTDLPPEVAYRLDEADDPAPPPAAPPKRSATVSPEAAAGKGSAHK